MKILGWVAAALGVIFLIIAAIYFMTPAHSLPSFFPGYDTTSKIHIKHAIGSLCLGLACFAFAWFQTGKKSPHKE